MTRFKRWKQGAALAVSLWGCEVMDEDVVPIAPRELAAEIGAAEGTPSTQALDSLERALQVLPVRAPCADRWCEIDPRARSDSPRGVSASSPDNVWFVHYNTWDYQHEAVFWDGASVKSVDIRPFRRVATTGPGSTWAYDSSKGGDAIARWDGRAFVPYSVPGAKTLWPVDADHVYVGTSDRGLYRWTGSDFTRVPEVDASRVLTSSGPDDVWAAGESSLWHHDGTSWREVEAMRGRQVDHIVSFGSRDVWLASRDSLFHFDGVSWTVRHVVSDGIEMTGDRIGGLAGSSSSNLWIRGPGKFIHFDGTSFRPGPATAREGAMARVGNAIYAVDGVGRVLRLEARPAFDVRALPVVAPRMHSVWASSRTDVWAVGAYGEIWNSDGTTFRRIGAGTSSTLRDIGGTGPNDVWIVGDRGVVLHGSRAGGFRALKTGVTEPLESVFAVAPGEAWIGGLNVLLHATPAGFERVAYPLRAGSSIVDLHGMGSSDVWALGHGEASHFDGRSWSAAHDVGLGVYNLWALSANDVWAAGTGCGHGSCPVSHWDGARWTYKMDIPPPEVWMFALYEGRARSTKIWTLGREEDRWGVDLDGVVLQRVKR